MKIFPRKVSLLCTSLSFSMAILCGCAPAKNGMVVTRDFEFRSGGKKLSGIIDEPSNREAKAVIIFVHGSGNTDIRRENRYFDLRSRFTSLGFTCVMWDKPGQGKSEGVFDENQPLEECAAEVLDAITWLRSKQLPGLEKIGVWSTSRGGWVTPIALSQTDGVSFWISVSGVPAEDNKYYLMQSNLPLEGKTQAETDILLKEWRRGREIFLQGGSYESYLEETVNLRRDEAVFYFAGDLTGTKVAYEAEQKAYMDEKGRYQFDENLSVMRVQDFAAMLGKLHMPVLALFGEKDTNVNWRNAKVLYEETIGRNPGATLSIHTFPECDHGMNVSETGWVREVEGMPLDAGVKCPGYYEVQMQWLEEYVLSRQEGVVAGQELRRNSIQE